MSETSEKDGAKGQVKHINPETLHRSPAYTQVVTVTGPVKMVYVGGQDAVDASGAIVGKGDLKAQVEQVMKNVVAALAAAGGGLEHVIKWNVHVLQGQSLQAGFEVFQRFWGDRPNPPTISGIFISGLAHPDFLCEIDAIAAVPE